MIEDFFKELHRGGAWLKGIISAALTRLDLDVQVTCLTLTLPRPHHFLFLEPPQKGLPSFKIRELVYFSSSQEGNKCVPIDKHLHKSVFNVRTCFVDRLQWDCLSKGN